MDYPIPSFSALLSTTSTVDKKRHLSDDNSERKTVANTDAASDAGHSVEIVGITTEATSETNEKRFKFVSSSIPVLTVTARNVVSNLSSSDVVTRDNQTLIGTNIRNSNEVKPNGPEASETETNRSSSARNTNDNIDTDSNIATTAIADLSSTTTHPFHCKRTGYLSQRSTTITKNNGEKLLFSNNKTRRGLELRISTSCQHFEDLVMDSTVFVDKTLLIKEFIESRTRYTLVTVPRRWIKTVNLRMLKTFFEIEIDANGNPVLPPKNKTLFTGGNIVNNYDEVIHLSPLQISKHPDILEKYMGQFPVIYWNMYSLSASSYEEILPLLRRELRNMYTKHRYLQTSQELNDDDKTVFRNYMVSAYETEDYLVDGLHNLCKFLCKHYGRKVILLIDEYDCGINHSIMQSNASDVQKIVDFFSRFFIQSMKENEYVYSALVTGTYEFVQTNYLPELSNFVQFGVSNSRYTPYFAFTEHEVQQLCTIYGIPLTLYDGIKQWYGGYQVEKYDLYNPWSIINFLSNWKVNGGTNSLHFRSFNNGSRTIAQFRELLR